jgi:hypothetical protein
MLSSGVIIVMGFVLIALKLPRVTALKLLGRPLLLDIAVATLAYVLHWGTFTGVMAAAFAGMLCSLITSGARWAFGYIEDRKYYPGKFVVRI